MRREKRKRKRKKGKEKTIRSYATVAKVLGGRKAGAPQLLLRVPALKPIVIPYRYIAVNNYIY